MHKTKTSKKRQAPIDQPEETRRDVGEEWGLPEWLKYCESLHPKEMEMGLNRVALVWQKMDLRLNFPLITVAGTNGKGSSCAMLEAIYGAAGYKTACHTSPHLLRFEERCRINGICVEGSALLPFFRLVEKARDEVALTWFEFTLLVFLAFFCAQKPRVLILEVGLGGRLDATNLLDADCALITSIGLDHTEWLGDNLDSIALEKAGIFRAEKKAVIADESAPAVLAHQAQQLGMELWCSGRDYQFKAQERQWSWRSVKAEQERYLPGLAQPALRGVHQMQNAAGVLAVVHAMRQALPVNAQAIREGLAHAQVAGRFQVVRGHKVPVVLDVAHNPHAVAVLVKNLDGMGFFPKTTAIFGVMADKDIEGMARLLAPLIADWYCCDLPIARAASGRTLAEKVQSLVDKNTAVKVFSTPKLALEQALARAALGESGATGAGQENHPVDRICVLGSFFTVAGVMEALRLAA